MPMRRMVSAPAIRGSPPSRPSPASQPPPAQPAFSGFFGTHRNKSLLDFDDYFLCNLMQRLCQWSGIVRPIAIGRTTPCDPHAKNRQRMPNLASTLHGWHLSIPNTRPMELSSCASEIRCFLPPWPLAIGVGLPGASGASRDRGALRHFDGRYSADDGPAGSRRRRLSVHRPIRSTIRWSPGKWTCRTGPASWCRGSPPNGRSTTRTRPSGASRLRKGVKFHDGSDFNADAVIWNLDKVLERQGAAIRQAPERAGEDPPALGRELRQDRRLHRRDHDQDRRLVLPLSDAVVSGLEPRAI